MKECPKCSSPDVELLKDEIDIGVGVQECIRGAECRACGAQFGMCDQCGAWDHSPHAEWCTA